MECRRQEPIGRRQGRRQGGGGRGKKAGERRQGVRKNQNENVQTEMTTDLVSMTSRRHTVGPARDTEWWRMKWVARGRGVSSHRPGRESV